MIGALTNAIAEVNGNEIIDYLTEEDKNKAAGQDKKEDEVNEFVESLEKEAVKVEKEDKPVKKEHPKKEFKKEEVKEVVEEKKEEKTEKESTSRRIKEIINK